MQRDSIGRNGTPKQPCDSLQNHPPWQASTVDFDKIIVHVGLPGSFWKEGRNLKIEVR